MNNVTRKRSSKGSPRSRKLLLALCDRRCGLFIVFSVMALLAGCAADQLVLVDSKLGNQQEAAVQGDLRSANDNAGLSRFAQSVQQQPPSQLGQAQRGSSQPVYHATDLAARQRQQFQATQLVNHANWNASGSPQYNVNPGWPANGQQTQHNMNPGWPANGQQTPFPVRKASYQEPYMNSGELRMAQADATQPGSVPMIQSMIPEQVQALPMPNAHEQQPMNPQPLNNQEQAMPYPQERQALPPVQPDYHFQGQTVPPSNESAHRQWQMRQQQAMQAAIRPRSPLDMGAFPNYGNPQPIRQNGINLVGSEFREPDRTANEIMIGLKDENTTLKGDIAILKSDIEKLKEELEAEKKARAGVEEQLANSQGQNSKLKQMVAKLQVKVEDLEQEKAKIKEDADKTLRQIESNLDTILLNSISRSKERNSLRASDQ